MPSSSRPSAAVNVSASASPDAAHRVIVLGATGFLGRHVSRRLEDLGIDHVRIGHTAGASVDAAIDLASSAQHDLDKLIGGIAPTAVINCAGAVSGTTADLTRGNVVAVHALLSALAWSAPAARLVQLGSSAEYGAVKTQSPMSEETPTEPTSPYGFTKLAASQLVLRSREQGADAIVLRIFNVSGPQSPTSTMLGGLVEQLLGADAETSIALDSLDGWRDYVDVRDVANAACIAATIDRPLPSVVNIARGEAVQTREWVERLLEVSRTGAQIVVKQGALGTHKSSARAVAWQCADVTAAKSGLAWAPEIDLAKSIADTWSAAWADTRSSA